MIVDDYYYQPPATVFDEVYADPISPQSATEVGDCLRICSLNGSVAVYNPDFNGLLGKLSAAVGHALRDSGYKNKHLKIVVTGRDVDLDRDCVRYGLSIMAVDGADLSPSRVSRVMPQQVRLFGE